MSALQVAPRVYLFPQKITQLQLIDGQQVFVTGDVFRYRGEVHRIENIHADLPFCAEQRKIIEERFRRYAFTLDLARA